MKKLIIVATLMIAGNTFAAQNLCGITVQNEGISRESGKVNRSVNLIRSLMKDDNATITECFTAEGAVIVGQFPDGEIRAVIF